MRQPHASLAGAAYRPLLTLLNLVDETDPSSISQDSAQNEVAVECFLMKRILKFAIFLRDFYETNIALGTNLPVIIEFDELDARRSITREKKQDYLLVKSRQNFKKVGSVTIQEIFVSETQFVPPSR